MADATSIVLGTAPRLRATFRNADGDLFDPSVVRFKVKGPDATIETFVYGVDLDVVRLSVGAYERKYLPATAGEYCWRAECEGDDWGASEGEIDVDGGCFA